MKGVEFKGIPFLLLNFCNFLESNDLLAVPSDSTGKKQCIRRVLMTNKVIVDRTADS